MHMIIYIHTYIHTYIHIYIYVCVYNYPYICRYLWSASSACPYFPFLIAWMVELKPARLSAPLLEWLYQYGAGFLICWNPKLQYAYALLHMHYQFDCPLQPFYFQFLFCSLRPSQVTTH